MLHSIRKAYDCFQNYVQFRTSFAIVLLMYKLHNNSKSNESIITYHLIKGCQLYFPVTKYFFPLYVIRIYADTNHLIFPYICYISYQNFFRLSPAFCFADGLASLALLRQGMKDKSSDGVFNWNVTGASICYLGLEVHFLSQSCMKLYACLQFYMLTSLWPCVCSWKNWVSITQLKKKM